MGEHKVKRCTKKSSKIIKLDPRVMDGLLRVGGRLANGSLQPDVKHPIILPKSHHVVILIIRHYHHFSGHSGVEKNYGLLALELPCENLLVFGLIAKDDRPKLANRRWGIYLRTELYQINLLSPMWGLIASVHS